MNEHVAVADLEVELEETGAYLAERDWPWSDYFLAFGPAPVDVVDR